MQQTGRKCEILRLKEGRQQKFDVKRADGNLRRACFTWYIDRLPTGFAPLVHRCSTAFPRTPRSKRPSAERALQLRPARGKLFGQAIADQLEQLVVQLQLALPLRDIHRADALVLVAAEALEPLPLQIGK